MPFNVVWQIALSASIQATARARTRELIISSSLLLVTAWNKYESLNVNFTVSVTKTNFSASLLKTIFNESQEEKKSTHHMAWTETGLNMCILLSVDTLKPLWRKQRGETLSEQPTVQENQKCICQFLTDMPHLPVTIQVDPCVTPQRKHHAYGKGTATPPQKLLICC